MISRVLAAASFALATLAISEAAMAEGHVAKVVVAGDDAEVGIVRASVTEQLDRLGVRADTDRTTSVRPEEVVDAEAGEPEMIARVWIDASAPSETVLYVADRSGSRVLVRRFPRAGRSEIAREAALAALQTAVDALLHGAPIGMSREEARAELGLQKTVDPAPPPPKKPPKRSPTPPEPEPPPATTMSLGLGYELGAYSSATFEHGPLASLSLSRPFQRRVFGLSLTGQYRFPIQATSEPVTLRLESGALRLNATMDLVRAGPIDLRGSIGGGFDVVRADPDLIGVVEAVLTPISRIDPVFRAGILGRTPLRLVPNASLELGLGVDFAPSVKPYAIARGAEQTTLLSPWTVRPLVILGITVP